MSEFEYDYNFIKTNLDTYKLKNLEIKDYHGNNSLMYLTKYNPDYNMIKKLLSYDFDVNFQDNYGNSLLHIAILRKDKELVKILLDYNANLESVNKKNQGIFDFCDQEMYDFIDNYLYEDYDYYYDIDDTFDD